MWTFPIQSVWTSCIQDVWTFTIHSVWILCMCHVCLGVSCVSCVSGVPRCARCVRFDTYVIDCFNGIKRRLCKHATARSQVGEATAATQEAKEAACCGVFLWRGGGLSEGSSWTLSDPHFSLPVPSKVGHQRHRRHRHRRQKHRQKNLFALPLCLW